MGNLTHTLILSFQVIFTQDTCRGYVLDGSTG